MPEAEKARHPCKLLSGVGWTYLERLYCIGEMQFIARCIGPTWGGNAAVDRPVGRTIAPFVQVWSLCAGQSDNCYPTPKGLLVPFL
jgi:hypothetical protein